MRDACKQKRPQGPTKPTLRCRKANTIFVPLPKASTKVLGSTDGTNLLFRGVGGNGAKDLADAYAFWASNGERFNTTGLSTRFDPVKAARFAEIVNNYKIKFER